MLFSFLKKQTSTKKKKVLIQTMVEALNIPESQKQLYVSALDVLNAEETHSLYKNLVVFVQEIEMKELDDIQKENFSTISGMRKKEAEEKAKEMNSFSFLLHNL